MLALRTIDDVEAHAIVFLEAFVTAGHNRREVSEQIIAALQENLEDFSFTKMRTGSGKYFFRISRNGLVLATSRKFSTELMLKKGLDQILKYVPEAVTLDFSEEEPVFPEVQEETQE